jgi:hypothetical protein
LYQSFRPEGAERGEQLRAASGAEKVLEMRGRALAPVDIAYTKIYIVVYANDHYVQDGQEAEGGGAENGAGYGYSLLGGAQ